MLRRERARCDRTSHGFSLVAFEPGELDASLEASERVLETLVARVRTTDEVGWLDHQSIAVILPGTPLEGARKLASDVRTALGSADITLRCTVNQYPPEGFPKDGDRDRDAAGSLRGARHVVAEQVPAAISAVHAPARMDASRASDEPVPRDPVRTSKEFESLLLRELPVGKRILDVAVSSAALLLASPVLLLAALAVKINSPGPMLFRQKRAGQGGIPFDFFKLRTMIVGAEELKQDLMTQNEQSGPVFKMSNDPRVTAVGRFLRKTSIDELPQLWNVLRGDMTLVGPRPPTLDEVANYDRWQLRRLEAKGGVTCIWQVSGRSLVGFKEWVRMDIRYIERQSPLLDLKLLCLTVPAVLTGRGAR